MLLRNIIIAAAVTFGASCATIPQLGGDDAVAARAAPYPDLVPLDSLLNAAQSNSSQITPATVNATNTRISALQNRAENLRRPVIDTATRNAMRAANARAALR